MSKNEYLERKRMIEQANLDVGYDIGFQTCFDLFCVVLHDSEIVGKDTFGRSRIIRICEGLHKYRRTFEDAYDFTSAEAEVKQRDLDSILKEIFGKDLVPFYGRYPDLKKISYTKRWKDKKKG